jgi:hypothetical protein
LAKAVAAVSRLHLENSWDRRTGAFKKDCPLYIDGLDMIGERLPHFEHLALAYDFIAPWMTGDEQRETRNLLFATSVGRPTGVRIFASQANGVVLNHGVERGCWTGTWPKGRRRPIGFSWTATGLSSRSTRCFCSRTAPARSYR